MKIDCIYIACNKEDFYFTKICLASIRYWNKDIPVFIIKDFSKGAFNTIETEKLLSVKVANTKIKNLGYYSKLFPFYNDAAIQRILILDSDVVWLCDMVALLEQYDEDIIVDGYSPIDIKSEMSKWYFTEPGFSKKIPDYTYPGFLFNVGQILCNTNVFTEKDLGPLLDWKEFPEPVIENAFFYEQGILNYLFAKKKQLKQITFRQLNFHLWGWDEKIKEIKIGDLKNKKNFPFLIHWYGNKNGLISFLPGSKILFFYESYYFSLGENKRVNQNTSRLKRTITNLRSFVYETAKAVYIFIKGKKT